MRGVGLRGVGNKNWEKHEFRNGSPLIEWRKIKRISGWKLTIVQRPRIPPVIELRRDIQRIETRADVANHPKDQPHRRPRLADNHRHVLARQSQRTHPEEVDHPIDDECGMPVRIRIMCWYRSWGRLIIERDLEGE